MQFPMIRTWGTGSFREEQQAKGLRKARYNRSYVMRTNTKKRW